MARLLVEIEDELKRELKIKLIREGETLKSWLTKSARAYVGGAEPRTVAVSRRASREESAPAASVAPRVIRRHDDYLD